jgi:SAM-dependent methyltransferase
VTDSFERYKDRRGLFTTEVSAYDAGRPGYPERVFEVLRERCGLGPGTDVLEIGAGTGQATARMLDLGASVTVVELGAEFATFLESKFAGRPLRVVHDAFEEVDLEPESFDIVAAATSFHWVPLPVGLQRAADTLRPGGSLALWWNVFGDLSRPDPFHEALVPVLERQAPELVDAPSAGNPGTGAHLYAIDAEARIAEIDTTQRFGPVHHELVSWTGRHTPGQARALFASFSPWLALPPDRRTEVLDALEELARDQFNGLVERPYLTSIYVASRLP